MTSNLIIRKERRESFWLLNFGFEIKVYFKSRIPLQDITISESHTITDNLSWGTDVPGMLLILEP